MDNRNSTTMPTPTTWLLDGNVLVALANVQHGFFERATHWAQSERISGATFALCSITEGTLLRVTPSAPGATEIERAWRILRSIHSRPDFVFWNEGFSYTEVPNAKLIGIKQITDAWLAQLARRNGCKLATFDKGLVSQHPDVAYLVP
jgi:predicted nucleic acid-binding protein